MHDACRSLITSVAVIAAILATASVSLAQRPDADVLRAIREEGFQRSQALEIVSWLSDVYGPRVTGTPAIEAAGEWAADRMRSWGLRVSEERFAYGRGWSLERFHAHLIEPQVMPIIGYPRAWTPGTDGTVTAEVVRGRRDVAHRRWNAIAADCAAGSCWRRSRATSGCWTATWCCGWTTACWRKRHGPLTGDRGRRAAAAAVRGCGTTCRRSSVEEGVVAVLDRGSDLSRVGGAPLGSDLVWPTQRTDGGTLFVGPGGSRSAGARAVVPAATIAVEHYNRMIRVLDMGLPVTARTAPPWTRSSRGFVRGAARVRVPPRPWTA